jgi:hypothetical protein
MVENGLRTTLDLQTKSQATMKKKYNSLVLHYFSALLLIMAMHSIFAIAFARGSTSLPENFLASIFETQNGGKMAL